MNFFNPFGRHRAESDRSKRAQPRAHAAGIISALQLLSSSAEVYAVNIRKGLIGASALAAALAVSPMAFAQPCGGFSHGASNSAYNNQAESGWQSSSTAPSSESANWNGGWQSRNQQTGVTERYARLTHEANEAIQRDPQLADQDVHAWVNANGVVVLRGEADSGAQAMRAQHVIAQYTGLKDFDNELYYPGMYGAQRMGVANENSPSQNAQSAENQNPAQSQPSENENNENAAANENNPNNQNNGAASPSGPSTGQNQGGNNWGNNQ